jgi:plasmid replication initiation protein
LLILTKIDSIKEFDGRSEFKITAKEMIDTFGLDKKSSYAQLSEVGDNLFERKLTLPLRGKNSFIRTRWVSDIEYNEGEGSITVNIAPKMLPLLTELKGNFTSYDLAHTAKFKSSYSHRIYQILAQWKSVGVVKLSLDGFRQRLQLTARYEQYKFLKAEILKPALAEINKHSNLKVQLTERKIGKRFRVS